jgi:putative peptide zinc metalloprotease protein
VAGTTVSADDASATTLGRTVTTSLSGSEVPRRAAGLELLGEMVGSGYRRPPLLVRRGDGQTVQVTPLLYRVLEAIDGRRDHEELAKVVSERVARLLVADDVRFLVESKLRPLGVLQGPDGVEPPTVRASPLLGLRLRFTVTNPKVTRGLAAPFAWLFHPAVAVAVVVAFVFVTWWTLFHTGLGTAMDDALHRPRLILVLIALTVASAAFHELGHAAACHRGGGRPGAMGAALYLVWPVFYTDVTDSYRLGRAARLRVDVGGLYFNVIFTLGTVGAWALTRTDALLVWSRSSWCRWRAS